jgi:predicted anti-sigma-YlaC factor YlaD
MRIFSSLILWTTVAASFLASGCSIRTYALRATADALSGPGGNYGTDDDPELIRSAAPFGLKTMEQLATALPDHRPIRLTLASGFTQYGYAFVNEEADRLADKSLAQSQVVMMRARRLYLRARDFALQGIEIAHPGSSAVLRGGDQAAWKPTLAQLQADDVPYLYWTAASWALAISTAKDDPNLFGDLPVVDAIMGRALALDETYDDGAIHEFYVAFDSSRSEAQGGGPAKAKQHLDRAQELSKGHKLGSLVSFAEGVLIQQQKKAEFVALLQKVVDTNVYADDPSWKKNRLGNIVARERARWLLSKLGDLFAE